MSTNDLNTPITAAQRDRGVRRTGCVAFATVATMLGAPPVGLVAALWTGELRWLWTALILGVAAMPVAALNATVARNIAARPVIDEGDPE
ncbi:hypothetical protein M3G03_10165 [Aestuariimicrobium sp. p3-SID1156]|uniref:hypothetical protein n=1 Tax=Aestuariimicrobium sp. p3-SID1156 TaxID=2916038 RepID=UPI00223B5766|nr:hypothetical protein [Aestuariimicrobium sp. p3-SID1156]MCT1459895.1 hypothetical protein [Aestuariimicrobium sp. p3-SID1156]